MPMRSAAAIAARSSSVILAGIFLPTISTPTSPILPIPDQGWSSGDRQRVGGVV
ncbi:MAG TPA: hypothetical protein VFM55_09835 [Micromonosporaceae bacterium]|nr:hypothetical protein [Micromonosporaceae bacterium]